MSNWSLDNIWNFLDSNWKGWENIHIFLSGSIFLAHSVYFAFAHSSISYALEVYAAANFCYLNKLIILNNKLLRIIQFKRKFYRVKQLYENFNILPINLFHNYKLLLLAHKWYYRRYALPDCFINFFVLLSSVFNYSARNSYNFYVTRCRSKLCSNSCKHRSVHLWNKLDVQLKATAVVKTFKMKILIY